MITSISINSKKVQTSPISGRNSKGYYTVWPDGSCEQYGEITAPTLTRLVGTHVSFERLYNTVRTCTQRIYFDVMGYVDLNSDQAKNFINS